MTFAINLTPTGQWLEKSTLTGQRLGVQCPKSRPLYGVVRHKLDCDGGPWRCDGAGNGSAAERPDLRGHQVVTIQDSHIILPTVRGLLNIHVTERQSNPVICKTKFHQNNVIWSQEWEPEHQVLVDDRGVAGMCVWHMKIWRVIIYAKGYYF
jgi:hypothetical protein